MADEEQPKKTGASPEEIAVAQQMPAVFANKVILTLTPVSGRLSFLEIGEDGTTAGRAAIVLLAHDLLALRRLLDQQLPDENVAALPAGKQNAP